MLRMHSIENLLFVLGISLLAFTLRNALLIS